MTVGKQTLQHSLTTASILHKTYDDKLCWVHTDFGATAWRLATAWKQCPAILQIFWQQTFQPNQLLKNWKKFTDMHWKSIPQRSYGTKQKLTFGEGTTENVFMILSGYSSLILEISRVPIPDPVPPPSECVSWNPWRQSHDSASFLTTSSTESTSSAPSV